jgi:hypothetical protein
MHTDRITKPFDDPTRRRAALVTGALLAFVLVWPVAAALFLILEPTSGPPGSEVTGRTGGEGAFSTPVLPLSTYLVAETAAASVSNPADPRLVPIGELVVDAAGNGAIVFHVPPVEPGGYVVMVFCPSCADFSGGQAMAPLADFRVTSPPPATDTAAGDQAGTVWVAALAALLLASVLLSAARRRLTGTSSTGDRD